MSKLESLAVVSGSLVTWAIVAAYLWGRLEVGDYDFEKGMGVIFWPIMIFAWVPMLVMRALCGIGRRRAKSSRLPKIPKATARSAP
jgi:hypothetical protein